MSIPSYRTNPSFNPPSYKSNETNLLYKSELGVGETYIGGLETIQDNDFSDNDSIATGDISEHHIIKIKVNSATRPTEELINNYGNNINSEGFSLEIGKNIKAIDTDSNRVTQIINKDFFKGDISQLYYRKALETLHSDVEDLKNVVYETERTVKENI
jgi:hypothetical protein